MRKDKAGTTSIDRVRSALGQLHADCQLKDVVDLCPELNWCQIFLAIDHLTQEGQVRVTLDIGGTYMVRTCQAD